MNQKRWIVFSLVFMFTAMIAGGAGAATVSTGGTSPTIIVGNPNSAISDIIIIEEFMNQLWAVEDDLGGDVSLHVEDQFNGTNDNSADLVYTTPPCRGDRFRFTVTLLEEGVTWLYAPALSPSTTSGTVSWIPSAGAGVNFPFSRPTSDLFPTNFIYDMNDMAWAVEALRFPSPRVSACYEVGHPVAIRNDQDPASGFASAYDVVVSAISGNQKTLVVDVIRRSTLASKPGRIVIPGCAFHVNTTGAEASVSESKPLRVRIESTNTDIQGTFGDLGNPGLTEATIQVATLVTRQTGQPGAQVQVVAEDTAIRDIRIGSTNAPASSIRIAEQFDRQFLVSEDSRVRITLTNGAQFTSPPTIAASGGLVASLNTTSTPDFPASSIEIDIDQDLTVPTAAEPGLIRISNVRLNVASTLTPGPINATVTPVNMTGLEAATVVIANAVTATVIGGTGAGAVVEQTVNATAGTVTVRLDASPATTVQGQLYVALQIPTADDILIPVNEDGVAEGYTRQEDEDGTAPLSAFTFFRPDDARVPLPNGLYVVLGTDEEGDPLPGAANEFYRSGTLSSTAADLTFFIGGLSGLVGETIEIRTMYKLDGQPLTRENLVTIQTVRLIVAGSAQ